MLNDYPSSDHPAAAEGLAGIIRLIRRVCLLREQGETEPAGRLQAGELAAAIAEFRRLNGPESLTQEKLCGLFVNETEHVREAIVLADIMAPRLARLLASAEPQPAPAFAPVGSSRAPARPAPGGPPAISDLLDAMLAAERPGRRSTSSRHREP